MIAQTFSLSHLRNEEYFEYLTDLSRAAKDAGIETGHPVSPTVAEYNAELKKIDEALEIIRKSALTDTLGAADTKRDRLYHSLRAAVEAELYAEDPVRTPAAQNVNIILDHYGNVAVLSADEETASLTNLIQDLNNKTGPECSLLALVPRINALAAANRAYQDTANFRAGETASRTKLRMVTQRREMDAAYRKLMYAATGLWTAADTKLTAYINKANAYTAHYKAIPHRRAGQKNSEENTPAPPPDVTVVTSNTGPA